MAEEKVFVSGLFIRRPNEKTKEKAPWVKLHLGIKAEEFATFLQEHKKSDGFVNVDIKLSKDGDKLYAELDTYVRKPKETEGQTYEEAPIKVANTGTDDEVDTKDIPF